MNIKKWMSYIAALLIASGTSAQAKENARLWELEVTTTVADGEPTSTKSWQCMGEADWLSPSPALTGAQCPEQIFARDGDSVRWSASCDAAQGTGEWIFSHRGRAVEGQSAIVSNGMSTVTRLDGEVTDKCTL